MFAKVAILFAALAAVNASVLLGHSALVNTGVSARSQTQDAYGNYAFGYDIKDGLGATNSRSEVGDAHGNKKGSYTLADIDGRARRVDYVADGHGFRAVVKTNEPGTAASAPAAALVASPYAGPVAPVVNHVAPAAAVIGHAASYAAPLAVAAPALAAPVAYGGVLGHGAAIAAPVAYGGVIGHGAALGTPLGLGYGLGYGKVAILFAALAAVNASVLLGHGALVNTGVSARSQTQDAYGNYAFGYDIKDGLGATNSRSEVGDAHGNKKGSYTLADIDGRARRVDYVADGHGFRAVVKTNEPGTAASAPAAALVASPYAGPVAPVVNHVAPAATVVGHAASYAAPLAVAAPALAGTVAYGGVLGHGAAIAAPVAYGGVIGHGASLGFGAPLGLGYGLGYVHKSSILTKMFAKVAILFAALAAVNASVLLGHGALVTTGVSARSQTQDAYGNYAFGYDIKDGLGATNSRSEVGDAYGNKKGSYSLADIDGRARRVDYVADGHGFRAVVKTNEPGTTASAPAAALVASPYTGPVAPVVNHVAPAATVVGHAASYAAPLAVAAPALAAPVAYGGVLGHGAALAAPVAYGGVIGHGAALGLAAPLGLGYSLGYANKNCPKVYYHDLVAILLAVLAAVNASVLLGHGALVNTGVSARSQTEDAYGNYAFGYDIKDGLGATNSRSEIGDAHGNKKGSYTLADIDGRTNEPGTAASAPAAALVASPYAGPVAPVVNHVAPAATVVGHAASYAAPLAVAAPVLAAPVAYGGVLGHGPAIAAPVAYGGVIGHGAALGHGAPFGLGYGLGYGKLTQTFEFAFIMFAKAIILLAVLAAVNASVLLGHGALVNTGVSASSRSQDEFGNYAFGYDIKDGLGATNSRSEVGDAHGNKKGSYTLADIDGRARRVDYVADGHGFRAVVKTNEPGTAASAPAAALIASPYAGPVAPVVNHVAPAAAVVGHAASYPAPLAVAAPAVAAPVAYGGVLGHGAAIAAPVAYGGVIGHRAAIAAPVAYGGVIGHGAAIAAPVAYGGVIGHGAALAAPVAYGGVLGHGSALGVGYGLGYGKALYH
ncbi:fibroin heavy chain-like [Argiope bruennichi]|uniref:fibroin heavy chain-like n=1 Tax=Argiope bruennichi TaxID=94029 RepID=UPI002493D31F|nr:fibroin heavy chain-like [Argiope bruennichi]